MRIRVTAMTIMLLCNTHSAWSGAAEEWAYQYTVSGYVGTALGASDNHDQFDAIGTGGAWFHAAVYHEHGQNEWEGPSGFYSTDIREPLPRTLGASKTWRIHAWANADLPPNYTFHAFNVLWAGPSGDVFRDIDFRLTFVRSAVGVSDPWHPIGETLVLNWRDAAGWMFPAYRTDNGLDGYIFELTATVIPEPSALFALGVGLAALGIRRRR